MLLFSQVYRIASAKAKQTHLYNRPGIMSFMQMAQITNMIAGTTMETRQATFGSIPEATIGLKSTDIIKILSHLYKQPLSGFENKMQKSL